MWSKVILWYGTGGSIARSSGERGDSDISKGFDRGYSFSRTMQSKLALKSHPVEVWLTHTIECSATLEKIQQEFRSWVGTR